MAGPAPPRELLFDIDYCSSAVWVADADGQLATTTVDWLPVSAELKAELDAWAEDWTHTAMADLIAGAEGAPDTGERAAIDDRGAVLLRRLREELGPGWRVGDVTYRDDGRYVQWSDDREPEHWPVPRSDD